MKYVAAIVIGTICMLIGDTGQSRLTFAQQMALVLGGVGMMWAGIIGLVMWARQ
jgi:hypothetical protein